LCGEFYSNELGRQPPRVKRITKEANQATKAQPRAIKAAFSMVVMSNHPGLTCDVPRETKAPLVRRGEGLHYAASAFGAVRLGSFNIQRIISPMIG
jgi:hypothetical protein